MQEGVLCYPIVDDEMLLLEKTRGHGAGKLVGPGGKIEPGESPRAAARRETREEVGVDVTGLEKVGELEFVFGDESYMHCHVFRADGVEGTPEPSDEGVPRWVDIEDPPYEKMWDGDTEWLPYLLEERHFEGTLRYGPDGEEFRGADLDVADP